MRGNNADIATPQPHTLTLWHLSHAATIGDHDRVDQMLANLTNDELNDLTAHVDRLYRACHGEKQKLRRHQ